MKAHLMSISAVFLAILYAGDAQTVQVETPEALAKKTGCFQCHKVTEKGIGPTFHDIATRYKNNLAVSDTLMKTIKNGGKGNWTELSRGVPMPPYSGRLSDAEIKSLVDWVLGL